MKSFHAFKPVLVLSALVVSAFSATLSHADLLVGPGAIMFGTVHVQQPFMQQQYIELSNTGTTPVHNLQMIANCAQPAFSFSTSCGNDLPAKTSCLVWVQFQPMAPGFYTCTVRVGDGDDTGEVDVSLSGDAIY